MGKRVQIFSTACVVALLAVALWHGRVLANPPQLVRYQAHLADAAGVPLAGVHTLAFAIFDQQASGALLWNEGPFPVTVQGGNVDIILGGHGTPLTSVLLTAPGRWLEVTVDGNVLQPRQRLASVPFALAADRLDTKTLAEVQADIDARIGAHAGLPAAHHVKTIDATDLIAGSLDPNRLADASIAPIKIADGPGSGLDADTLDGIDSTTFSLAASRTRTALQIATLRWYEADQTGLTFPVGNTPEGVAFDGSSIWVSNFVDNSVTKLRASDGTLLGTFPVGPNPEGVAFDGTNIWVANRAGPTVTKLRASDGTVLGTFTVGGTTPTGIVFDGSSIWTANNTSDNVSKLRPSDGTVLGTFPVGARPWNVAFDGSSIWVTNRNANSVTKLRASDGGLLGTFSVGQVPTGVAFDGSSIWVANEISHTVTKLRAADGAVLGTFPVGQFPFGVVFDGSSIWVASVGPDSVTKLRASDGALLGTFSVGTDPMWMAFDGSGIWVSNEADDTISRL